MGEEYKDMLGLVELIKYHIVEFIDWTILLFLYRIYIFF
jgi:hypothetical protein